MAGDWMKIDLELPDKPEVFAIAGMVNKEPEFVVGALIKIWAWFDKHTTDGNAFGVTFSLPDRISGVTGFGEAMMFVGWLQQNDKTLSMPKFDSHTSQSAKTRALTNKRVEKLRNANVTPPPLPREEKRREENKYKPPISESLLADFLKVRKAKKAGDLTKTAFDGISREAAKAGISVEDAIKECCTRGWVGFKSEWYKNSNKTEQSEIPEWKKGMI